MTKLLFEISFLGSVCGHLPIHLVLSQTFRSTLTLAAINRSEEWF